MYDGSDYTERKMVKRVTTNASGGTSMQIGFGAASSSVARARVPVNSLPDYGDVSYGC
jgi:hypothetical protein